MSSLNKCQFIGNVGKEPIIRSTQNGKEIASFSIGCSEKWKDKQSGEQKEKTEWVNITVFSEWLVNVIKSYVKKGSKIYIEGQLQTRKYTDKQGIEKYATDIVLQGFNGKLILLDSKGSNSGGNSGFGNAYETQKPDVPEDEIPF